MRELGVYDRSYARNKYSSQDPEEFLKQNGGIKQDDGSWVMRRNLILRDKSPIVENGRFIVKFKEIIGNFNCSGQKLTSLEGCPEEIGGNFWCGVNYLQTLKGGPKKVGGNYECGHNKITSLFSLKDVEYNSLDVSYNKLKDFKYLPKEIKGELNMEGNQLTSLEGMPQTGEEADFSHNMLETLYGYKIPLNGNSIKLFNNNITISEKDFVSYMYYDIRKIYKHYHKKLLNFIVERKNIEDLEKIKWPERMIKSGLIDKTLKSLKSLDKYNL